jgi:hypothetical protein
VIRDSRIIVKNAIISTIVLAAVATFGDWIWASFLPTHRMVAGLTHGALLCLAMGAVLGQPVRRAGRGAAAGLVVGLLAAGTFYLLAPVLRYAAMFPAWFLLWVMLSVAHGRLAGGTRAWSGTIARGIVAGLASGVAFYFVSGMWTRWDPATINYIDHYARWAVAFAPGFLALQVGTRQPMRIS